MYDVTFCVILVTTLLSGYYRRDERNREFLERYNDEFPQQAKVNVELEHIFKFVEECGFEKNSRAWKQTDLLTLLVELHKAIAVDGLKLEPPSVGPVLRDFYESVNEMYRYRDLPDEEEIPSGKETTFKYMKAATKATNDKYARIDRAEVISDLIRSTTGVPMGQASKPKHKTDPDPEGTAVAAAVPKKQKATKETKNSGGKAATKKYTPKKR